MSLTLEVLRAEVLRLAPDDRSRLLRDVVASLDDKSDDSPEAAAAAWDEEIARRVAEMDAGLTEWIPGDVVMAELRAIATGGHATSPDH